MTQIFFLTGTTSFPDPGNWNPVNSVEIVGAGGSCSRTRPSVCTPFAAGGGGSGGGYGRGNNRNDPFPVALRIASGNSITTGNTYSNWADPSGGGSTGNINKGTVWAGGAAAWQQGSSLQGDAGGPDVGYKGGSGGSSGASTAPSTYYGGAGGGAGGPHGGGLNGTGGATSPTTGGAGDNGTGGAGGTGASGNGGSGTQWDPSHGCGGGSSGGIAAATGGVAGKYGGGAGGPGNTYTSYNYGADALMIVNYTPLLPPPPMNVCIMA